MDNNKIKNDIIGITYIQEVFQQNLNISNVEFDMSYLEILQFIKDNIEFKNYSPEDVLNILNQIIQLPYTQDELKLWLMEFFQDYTLYSDLSINDYKDNYIKYFYYKTLYNKLQDLNCKYLESKFNLSIKQQLDNLLPIIAQISDEYSSFALKYSEEGKL